MTTARQNPPPREENDGRESRHAVPLGAPSFAASSPAALSRRARAHRRRVRRAVGARALAQPADQARRPTDGGRRRRHDGAAHRPAPQRPARPAGDRGEPGRGGGTIAANMVARARPDGYTLIFQSVSSAVVNALVYKNLPYDPVKDLIPVTLAGRFPLVLIANPDVPAKDLGELIALLKANPGKYSY